jgi:hypothetical protein
MLDRFAELETSSRLLGVFLCIQMYTYTNNCILLQRQGFQPSPWPTSPAVPKSGHRTRNWYGAVQESGTKEYIIYIIYIFISVIYPYISL